MQRYGGQLLLAIVRDNFLFALGDSSHASAPDKHRQGTDFVLIAFMFFVRLFL